MDSTGILTGFIPGSLTRVSTPPFNWVLGQPKELFLQGLVDVCTGGIAGDTPVLSQTVANFGHTISFATDRPVLDLPPGFTANSASGAIVNNRFVALQGTPPPLAPPACYLAQASPALLWPPDHKLLAVAIVGVADPDNDQATLTVTEVTQDEPVDGLGDGDTTPDAVIQGATVLLRAERAGTGNGRVYRVTFRADDGFGGRCTGSVAVCVPHSRQASACDDDGQRYRSTQP